MFNSILSFYAVKGLDVLELKVYLYILVANVIKLCKQCNNLRFSQAPYNVPMLFRSLMEHRLFCRGGG